MAQIDKVVRIGEQHENFNKIVRPGTAAHYDEGRRFSVYCHIKFKDGKLSITGVEGPYQGGNCAGGCGQIDMHMDAKYRERMKFAPGWDAAKFERFLEVWKHWHLNDMRPYCEHQQALGWDEQAQREVTLYHWTMDSETLAEKKAAEARAIDALKAGATFTPSMHETAIAVLPYECTTHTPEAPPHYKPASETSYKRHEEKKTLGWLKPSEHPDGLMGRPCPTCGYQYGHAWKTFEVPAEVLEFLEALPVTDQKPAWV
jgi:hypothetical protein